MADTVIYGTSGNDSINAAGATGVSNGSLILTLAGSSGEGLWPTFDLLINGSVVRSSATVSANEYTGYTQQVYFQLPGTVINSIAIDFTNDAQNEYNSGDRNIFIHDVNLNGTHLAVANAVYTRDGFSGTGDQAHTIQGQEQMYWGGEMTWTGSQVSGATAGAGGVRLIDAMGGIDTVTFAGTRAGATIAAGPLGVAVTASTGGTTYLAETERIQFADGNKVAIDMAGNAGVAAKMIAALLGNSFLSNEGIVGLALQYLDMGMSTSALAGAAAETDGFKSLAGGGSNADYVRFVYHNLVGSDPSASDLSSITSLLDSGQFTKGSLTEYVMGLEITGTRVAQAGVHDFIDYS